MTMLVLLVIGFSQAGPSPTGCPIQVESRADAGSYTDAGTKADAGVAVVDAGEVDAGKKTTTDAGTNKGQAKK